MILYGFLIAFLVALANAIQLQDQTTKSAPNAPEGYAPTSGRCPSFALIRPASSGIGNEEQAYFNARKPVADNALRSWLARVGFREVSAPSRYPSVGMSVSGGGYRSMLEGAGVIQGFDSRDSTAKVAGLYQALTYQSGLSGGAWLLSSIAGNNWSTVSSLVAKLWSSTLSNVILAPGGLLGAPFNTARILSDIKSKSSAGYEVSLTDPWGRLISFQVLGGGGFFDIVAETFSSVTQLSSFKSYSVPYPILTAIQTRPGECLPRGVGPQFEIHPYEFGSWDGGIEAFMRTPYLGTRMNNGVPLNSTCTQGFDDLGFIIGTSSNLFSVACDYTRNSANPDASAEINRALGTFLGGVPYDPDDLEYACYPNPFQNSPGSPRVSNLEKLHLVDGGLTNQNDPIWPFVQEARSRVLDVLIISDNSADTTFYWPNGSEIGATYQQATSFRLSRMPRIPNVSTFVTEGLNKRATFFGCNNPNVLTLIYLPNTQYTYPSNMSTFTFSYTPSQTASMIANGNAIATQNGDPEWPVCLACGIMQKTATRLPDNCAACLAKYCHSGISTSYNNNLENANNIIAKEQRGRPYSGIGTPSFTPDFQPERPSYYNNPRRPGGSSKYGGPGGPFRHPGSGRPGNGPNSGNPNRPNSPPNSGNPNYPNGSPNNGNPNRPNSPPNNGNPNRPNNPPNSGNPNYQNDPPNNGNPNRPNGPSNSGKPGNPSNPSPGNSGGSGGSDFFSGLFGGSNSGDSGSSGSSGFFGGLFGGSNSGSSGGSGSSGPSGGLFGGSNSGNSGGLFGGSKSGSSSGSGFFGGFPGFGGSSNPTSSPTPNHPNNNNNGGSNSPKFGSGSSCGSPSSGLFGGEGIFGCSGPSGGHPNGGGPASPGGYPNNGGYPINGGYTNNGGRPNSNGPNAPGGHPNNAGPSPPNGRPNNGGNGPSGGPPGARPGGNNPGNRGESGKGPRRDR